MNMHEKQAYDAGLEHTVLMINTLRADRIWSALRCFQVRKCFT